MKFNQHRIFNKLLLIFYHTILTAWPFFCFICNKLNMVLYYCIALTVLINDILSPFTSPLSSRSIIEWVHLHTYWIAPLDFGFKKISFLKINGIRNMWLNLSTTTTNVAFNAPIAAYQQQTETWVLLSSSRQFFLWQNFCNSKKHVQQ